MNTTLTTDRRLAAFLLVLLAPLAGCGDDTAAAPADEHAGEAAGAHDEGGTPRARAPRSR